MAKPCPQCQKENPSSANFCMFCSSSLIEDKEIDKVDVLNKELTDAKDTIKILKDALKEKEHQKEEILVSPIKIERVVSTQEKPETIYSNSTNKTVPDEKNKQFPNSIMIVGISLLLIVGGAIGYYAFYLPYTIDRDAPRFYTFALNTVLRSSEEAGVDYNKLASIPYGSELIVYRKTVDWSEVKWRNNQSNTSIKGYISSAFILSDSDFKILNSIWGDNESKEIINTGKCRIALLNYFKSNNLTEWQVFSKSKDSKINSSYYKRVSNPNSKFTNFAVIIKNIATNQRKCLLFSFDDDETPHLIYEEDAPSTGDIFYISRESYSYHISYR